MTATPTLGLLAVALLAGSAVSASARRLRLSGDHQYPHDTAGVYPGLVLQGGRLFESTGFMVVVAARSGPPHRFVIRSVSVPSQYFAEGIRFFRARSFRSPAVADGLHLQPDTFAPIGQFSYTGEAGALLMTRRT